jgi:chromosome condensin MukBEF ATPase and DNA-binding subunit MukB
MYDNGGGNGGMWAAIIGTATIVVGALISQMTKGSRKAASINEVASLAAETNVIDILRDEVSRLSVRLKAVEQESNDLKGKVAILQADLDAEKFRVMQLKRLIDPVKLQEIT